jgi:hypothetical protein
MIRVRWYEWFCVKLGLWTVELDRFVAEKTHSRSGKLDSGHTRMALGNTRMGWLENGGFGAGTRHTRVIRVSLEWYAYGVCYTRMSERDDVLNVKASLLVRVWGCGTRSIRVWAWAIRVWDGRGNAPYAYGHRRYAYGQTCGFSELLLCSFWLFRLSDVT